MDKAERAYAYIEDELRARMDEQERLWDRQDARRAAARTRYKQRQQARIDLQRKAGQMVTTTELYLSTKPVPSPTELPALTRRALRNGEFLPHARGCCVSSCRHSSCLISPRLLEDALALQRDEDDDYRLGLMRRKAYSSLGPKDNRVSFSGRRREALAHFRQLAGQEEPLGENRPDSDAADEGSESDPQNRIPPTPAQVLAGNPLKTEYLAGMLTKSYRPEELDMLVEQERRDRAGSRVLASKLFTTSELGTVPTYSGEVDALDKTRAPGEAASFCGSRSQTVLSASGAAGVGGSTGGLKSNQIGQIQAVEPVVHPSLPQLIKAAKLAEMTDADGVLEVELAPETQESLRRSQELRQPQKSVAFAGAADLERAAFGAGDEEESASASREDPESWRGMESEEEGGKGAADARRAAERAECLRELEWFSRRHGV